MPTGHFRHYLEHYLAPHPSQEVRELFISTSILDFAMALVMVFEPIYLYSQKFSLEQILWFYFAVYALYFVFLPIGGRICRNHGYEHTILLSSPFLILYYLAFFAVSYNKLFIAAAVVFLVIQKVLYWPSYHSNFATWSDGREGGREISNMSALSGFVASLAPVIGGLIAATAGFRTLFAVAAVLILVSNIPMLRTPEIFIPKAFAYGAAVKRVFSKENRRTLLACFGFGEELIALVLWPIFIASVVPDLLSLGAIVSLSMLANVLVTLYVGGLCDDGAKTPVLRSGTAFVTASWLTRLLVTGGLGVFLIDSFYRVAKNMVGVPFAAILYDDARRGGVTETVVFFEMALSLGKMAACVAAIVIFRLVPGFWTGIFILAAVFALAFSSLREGQKRVVT